MGPALTTERKQADQRFKDPKVREQIAGWHRQGMSFEDMLKQLGIPVSDELKKVLDDMGAAEIASIRKAILDEIGRAGTSDSAAMPIDCPNIAPVPVTITETAQGRIKVTPK